MGYILFNVLDDYWFGINKYFIVALKMNKYKINY
jgi:hypothetical protein